MGSSKVLALVLGTLLVAACADSPTSPVAEEWTPAAHVSGEWEVKKISDAPLPRIRDNTGTCETLELGGWLSIREGGTFEMEYDRHAELCDGKLVRTQFTRTSGNWSMSGDHIELRAGGPAGGRYAGEYINTGVLRLEIEIDGRTHWFGRRGGGY